MRMRLKQLWADEYSYFFILPALLWQLLFLLIPLLFIVGLSISAGTILLPHITLSHYAAILTPLYAKIILRSIVLAGATAGISLVLAYPLAYYFAIYARARKNVGLFFIVLPFWTNFLVLVYSWFFLLERDGILNKLLIAIGLISEPIRLFNTLFAVMLVMVYCYLPFMVLPIVTTLEQLDRTLLEASADLGATPRQTFWRIVMPLSMPGVWIGMRLVFVPAFGEFAIPSLVGGDKLMYVGTLISHYFLVARDVRQGAAFTVICGIVLLVLVVGLMLFIMRVQKGKVFR